MAFLPRKLQHHNEHISHSPGPGPVLAPSPSPIQPSLSLPFPIPISPKLPFPLIPIHDEGIHMNVLRLGMILMASTVGIMMLLCTVSLIRRSCCSRRRRNAPILFHINGDSGVLGSDFDDDEGALVHHPVWFIRTVGLQQSVIDSMTVFVYRKGERLIDGTECSVCLAEFQEDDTLRLLPKCSHAFHVPCIDTWLRSHQNCPLCRAPVLHESSAAPGATATATSTEMIVTEADSTGSAENQEMENLDDRESSSVRIIADEDDRGEDGENMNMQRDAEDITEPVRRSVSMDSSSIICDLNSSKGSGGSSSSRIYKLASIAFQKRPRKCSSSTHTRSHSSSLPL
ncbi:hypothetical protein PIB30_028226 [Stylosanthes scabra]|uniref:RING-type E3 ubiquitin transferase n=1 Tax=Stylosanthes scabra TaxID=79078 RepID=A0ABU6U9P3_9FABA|nr:hypothetical protein [Stylosanthes scabra]